MNEREQAIEDAEYLEKCCIHSAVIDKTIKRLCEYVQQDPDPDAALWAEIDGLLGKLNKRDSERPYRVLRRGSPVLWRIVIWEDSESSGHWHGCELHRWAGLQMIRDQLRTLATKRDLLTPSLEDMQAITKAMPDDGDYLLSKEKAAKFKAIIAALAVKEGG